MTATVTNELIYEVLKKMQADLAHVRDRVDDHDEQFISMREAMLGLGRELNVIKGDLLRVDKQIVGVAHRLDRIERRLDLVDA